MDAAAYTIKNGMVREDGWFLESSFQTQLPNTPSARRNVTRDRYSKRSRTGGEGEKVLRNRSAFLTCILKSEFVTNSSSNFRVWTLCSNTSWSLNLQILALFHSAFVFSSIELLALTLRCGFHVGCSFPKDNISCIKVWLSWLFSGRGKSDERRRLLLIFETGSWGELNTKVSRSFQKKKK